MDDPRSQWRRDDIADGRGFRANAVSLHARLESSVGRDESRPHITVHSGTRERRAVTAQSFAPAPEFGGLVAAEVTSAFAARAVGQHTLRLVHGTLDDVLPPLDLRVS